MPVRSLILILTTFLALSLKAQKTDVDTTASKAPESWKRFFPGVRLAFGAQKAFYTELGIGFQKYTYDARHGYIASAFYASFEWTPSRHNRATVYGVKLGAETVNNGATGGIEIKYMTSNGVTDIVITPKYGIGIGAATIFYGYNISTEKRPYLNIGRHQLSFAINSNLFFYHLKKK